MEPTLRLPSTDTQDAIYDALDYDPETGDIHWRTNRRRVTEGDLAGSINRENKLVIGFQRTSYQAAHIAWFFANGSWPLAPVLFKDSDPMNLKAENLYLSLPPYVEGSKARYMRGYRERRKSMRAAAELKSNHPLVTYTAASDGAWCVRAPDNQRAVLATFKNRKEAESYAGMVVHGARYCAANPSPKFPEPAASERAGGPSALTLQQASNRFAYDPDVGAIFYRARPGYDPDNLKRINWEGMPAVMLDGTRRPVVQAPGRVYGAGMLAWFLHTGDWPRRKQLGYRDGNPKNLKFTNLYVRNGANAPDDL